MNLKYFSLNDDKDTIKKKWKKLAVKFHPDKNRGDEVAATKKMQEINSELEYCVKFGGGFDGGKFDAKNPSDFRELMKILVMEMIEDVLRSEKNKSVAAFYMRAKKIIEHGMDSPPLITIIKD